MSALNAGKTAAPPQVACGTADNDEISVDLNVLSVSGTFKKMHEDLGLEEHDRFPGVFPVKTVSTRIFKRVIDWCKEHKDDPELVVEKDPLTQVCKWFTFTDYEKSFFDVPISELFELIMAANYLDIPRLYHYACQSVAARVKGKALAPREMCKMLHHYYDLYDAQLRKSLRGNTWLERACKNAIFFPNEVLVTIFEKLPREDLERLRLVSTQFNDVIVSSSELSQQQRPWCVVTKLEIGRDSIPHLAMFFRKIEVWPRDGTRFTCPDYDNLAKRLKFSVVQNLRYRAGYDRQASIDIQGLSALLPIKSAWKNAAIEVTMGDFSSWALLEFAFTQLFLCKEIILIGEVQSFTLPRPCMRLPAIAACNTLDVRGLTDCEIQPADAVEWLEHEVPPEQKWSEPRKLILDERRISGGTVGLLTALKTAFLASSKPKAYVVHVHRVFVVGINVVIANEQTHERLTVRSGENWVLIVKRA